MIDLNAPIIPFESIGGIKLYSSISDLYDIIEKTKGEPLVVGKTRARYEIEDSIFLFFNLVNGKLFKITTSKNYKGKLMDKICVGMHIDEVLKIEPSFEYEDFEEVYISPKGIYIETDPKDDTVIWISVYVKEIDQIDYEDFDRGKW